MEYRRVVGVGWAVLVGMGFWACSLGPEEVARIEAEALDVLLAFLHEGEREGAHAGWAAETLGLLKPPEAVPALIEALGHPEEFVVFKAIQALDRIDDRRAVEPLETVFEKRAESSLKVEISLALVRLGRAKKD